jgi:hypothetical protein
MTIHRNTDPHGVTVICDGECDREFEVKQPEGSSNEVFMLYVGAQLGFSGWDISLDQTTKCPEHSVEART